MIDFIFYIAVAAAVIGRHLDISIARTQRDWGVTEGLPFFQDKFGYLNATKNAIGSYGTIVAAVVVWNLWPESGLAYGGLTAIAVMAVSSFLIVAQNKKLRSGTRVEQVNYLRSLNDVGAEYKIARKKWPGPLRSRGGEQWFVLFGRFTEPGSRGVDEAAAAIIRRLAEHARKPESEWFSKG